MNDEEIELIGLYAGNELPEALKQLIEKKIESDPEYASEVASLRATVNKLKSVPLAQPDNWFVDRALNGLLRENEESQSKPLRFG